MDNEIIKNTAEEAAGEATVSLEKNIPEAAETAAAPTSAPAFDYQPPVVEAPQPPTVDELPTQVEIPVQPSVEVPSAPQVEMPQAQQYQMPQMPQYQQPQAQQYQQPQMPQYQQPQMPQYQQPQAQQYQPSQTPQPYNQQTYYQYAPVNPAVVSQQNTADGFAVASLICGIVGLLSCCTFIPSLLAVIFGAISKVKNDGSRPTGMSTAGLILGIIGMIISVLWVAAMIFYN